MVSAGLIATTQQRMVLGLGVTGCSVARWWRSQGLPFKAADTRNHMAERPEVRAALGECEAYFGELDPNLVNDVTELVVSPGIGLDHPLVLHARDNGARIIGDIDLFMAQARAPVIGITGSNGKTTVTELVGHLLRHSGKRVAVGGNLGTPALDLLDDAVDYYVLELSSFQLERSEELGLTVATVLNVSADHLDRHGSLPLYHQAKHRIFRGAKAVVANRADPLTIPLLEAPVDVVLWRPDEPDLAELGTRYIDNKQFICRGFEALLPVDELQLQGQHNVANVLAALACAVAAGLPLEVLAQGVMSFHGLPHRCEKIADAKGVLWINDSKGTNTGATLAALTGLGGSANVILIAGGVGKGQDFSVLAPAVKQHCKRVLTLGESAREIELALGGTAPCQRVADVDAAVERAAQLSEPGDVVLLSPACASFDQFSGYQARGDAFRAAVMRRIGGGL